MAITWFSKTLRGSISIYETNITINTVAAANFKNAYSTLVGYDVENKSLVIKAISKEEIDLGIYNEAELHPIAIKPSYGRISGKNIIKNICEFVPLDFKKKQFYKFYTNWNKEQKMLVVDLTKEVE
ncbi:MAG: hypothetical protein J5691_06290 [Bacilli bacterium]|nr:hypothetical protein [Bacilli bacterium]